MPPREAALRGAREIGFTVLSMSISLVAVFIPILLMGGIVGRLFREFAVTLSVAIVVSLVVSLTTTPMMCARVAAAARASARTAGCTAPASASSTGCCARYDTQLWRGRCAIRALMLSLTLLTVALNVYLFMIVPKGFFPQQDTGRLTGIMQADQDISFQAMQEKLARARRRSCGSDPGGGERDRPSPAAAAAAAARNTGAHVHRAEAARRARRSAPTRSSPGCAAKLAHGARRADSSCSRCRTCASAAGRATRSISTRCRARRSTS